MTVFILLTSLLAAESPKKPAIEDVRKAWEQQATANRTLEIEWEVVRDSRTQTLGFSPEESPRPGRLWLERNKARIDQFCLLAPGRDGRLHPQNRDRMANRHEFQRVLLDEKLEGDMPIPQWREVSLLVSSRRPLPSNPWGQLVQLACVAPALAARPDFALGREDIDVTDRQARMMNRRLPVLKVQREATIHDEVWVDPQHGYRVVRWLQWTDNEPSGQIDISYDKSALSQPMGWTVMEFDDQGNVVDFLAAEVTAYRLGVTIPAGTFDVTEEDWNQADNVSWSSSAQRIFSWMLYTTWFQVLAVFVILGAIIAWQRRKRPPEAVSNREPP